MKAFCYSPRQFNGAFTFLEVKSYDLWKECRHHNYSSLLFPVSLFSCSFICCMSVFFRCPGASCGPRTREGRFPAGDPETGAAAEKPAEAPAWFWSTKPRGNRRKAQFLCQRADLCEWWLQSNRTGRIFFVGLKMTPNSEIYTDREIVLLNSCGFCVR